MEAVVKNFRTSIMIGMCLSLFVGALAFAQQRPGGLAKEEAAELLEQRRKAAEEMNGDDRLLHQGIGIRNNAAAIVGAETNLSEEAARKSQERFLEEARQIVSSSLARVDGDVAKLLENDDLVQRNLRGAGQLAQQAEDGPPVRYQLYISQSMGRPALQTALAQAEANQDMVLVLRGLKRGQKFADIMKLVSDLHVFKAGDAIPRIIIDPTQFTDNNVTVVPTLTKLDDNGRVVATVRGIANPRWLEDQVRSGRRGDLGRSGATETIDEIDMITLLQEQAKKIDFEAYGRKQLQEFWEKRDWTRLPTATKSRTRNVDPTVVMTETITAPDGTVLAYPGQRLNPFDVMPFNMKLLIINGSDDAQVAWARRQVLANEGKDVRIIATEFPMEKGGWEEYDRLILDVGRMVYLLEDHLKERFHIEKVPTLIEGGNRVLVVREFSREEISQGVANARHVSQAR